MLFLLMTLCTINTSQAQELKEQEIKEQEIKEQEIKEQKIKEQEIKGQKIKEHKIKDHKIKDHKIKDHKIKDQKIKDQKIKEQKIKEQEIKEQKIKEQKIKEHKIKEQKIKEHKIKEQKIKEQKIKEQKIKEQKIKEQKIKEQKIKEQKIKGQKIKEQKIKEQPIYYNQSIGGGIGNLIHFSYKAFLFEDIAAEVSVGSFFLGEEGTYGIIKLQSHTKTKYDNLTYYYGGGFITQIGNGIDNIGMMFPIGAESMFVQERFNVYGDIAPVINYQRGQALFSSFSNPEFNFSLIVSFGVRFIFHR